MLALPSKLCVCAECVLCTLLQLCATLPLALCPPGKQLRLTVLHCNCQLLLLRLLLALLGPAWHGGKQWELESALERNR